MKTPMKIERMFMLKMYLNCLVLRRTESGALSIFTWRSMRSWSRERSVLWSSAHSSSSQFMIASFDSDFWLMIS